MCVLMTVLIYSSLSCHFIVNVCAGDFCFVPLFLLSLLVMFVLVTVLVYFSLSCARDCLGFIFSLSCIFIAHVYVGDCLGLLFSFLSLYW